jgi:MoaA/NifB/PqqE/SkfB family radical SAM enzyme
VGINLVEIILRKIIELTPTLYITGGEPTLEPNIGEVLRLARQIGFWPVCINTNAIVLDKRPEVPVYADKVVVSLHAGTAKKHAEVLGVSERQGERVFDNIVQTSKVAKSYGNTLSVNCVLTGDNIGEARGVIEFCLAHKISIAVVPAIQRHMPMIANGEADKLRDYRDFLGEVIRLKARQPDAVVGTRSYLEHIRRLGGFQCRPSGIITISQGGHIVNPCDYKYHTVPKTLGETDGTKSIESQLRHHLEFASAYESCGGNCLKMCYLEPALVLENPWLTIGEFLR